MRLRLILWILSLLAFLSAWVGGFLYYSSLREAIFKEAERQALGQTNREVAEAYGIGIKTVNTYRDRLLKKLNLRNNTELARFAIQNRLVEP